MNLFFRKFGQGSPVVILHGLYGSSDNWVSFAKKLSDSFTVYIPDLRNHGNSPHDIEHTYYSICRDIEVFFITNNIGKAILLGHSMGGKAATLFTSLNPKLVEKLIVADIYPFGAVNKDIAEFHSKVFESIEKINLNEVKSFMEAGELLFSCLGDRKLSNFLLKNISRKDEKLFWKLNIESIKNNRNNIFAGLEIKDPIYTETLILKGENSDYISEDNRIELNYSFPNHEFRVITKAGHWLHADNPEEFIATFTDFVYR